MGLPSYASRNLSTRAAYLRSRTISRGQLISARARPWPLVEPEDRWTVELFETVLDSTPLGAEELEERAAELRDEAAEADLAGERVAKLALAERYAEAARDRD